MQDPTGAPCAWRRCYSGVVHPWLCDALGHLNTRHYVAMFDDALAVVLAQLGHRPGQPRGWVDVRNEIDYLAEARVGNVLEIFACVSKIGGKSMTLDSEMRAIDGAPLHARMRAVVVYFDLELRQSVQIPEDIRLKATAMSAAPP
jgi:acyl-CoA thioester hydrolase